MELSRPDAIIYSAACNAAVAKLRADNIKTEDIIDCSWVTPGLRMRFFRGPDGNRIELMQGYKDE